MFNQIHSVMRKSILMLGVAVAALASCTNEEVVEMASNRAINFDGFVDNNVRAVTEVTTLSDFYVFGAYGADNYTNIVYNNESKTKQAYWTASQTYRFAAYANGDAKNLSDASYNYTDQALNFPSYTPDDANDLVAAIANDITCSDPASQGKVELTFKHMLSQVKFTFETKETDAYTIKISNLKINGAITQGDGKYDYTDGITWTGTPSGTYDYTTINDVAVETKDNTASEVKLVIPQTLKQGETYPITVTFTATASGPGITGEISGNFKATLKYEGQNLVSGTTENNWTPGFCYNYITSISADDIDPTMTEKIIEFEVKEVTDWKDATNTTYDLIKE